MGNEKKSSGMLDKHGVEIMEGDILLGSFYGQGGWWYEHAVVRHSTDKGFYLEDEGHNFIDFSHPKFRLAERREVKGKLSAGQAWTQRIECENYNVKLGMQNGELGNDTGFGDNGALGRIIHLGQSPHAVVGYNAALDMVSGCYNIALGLNKYPDNEDIPYFLPENGEKYLHNAPEDCPDPASKNKSRFVCRRCKHLETCKPSQRAK